MMQFPKNLSRFIKLQRYEADIPIYDAIASAIKNKITDSISMTADDLKHLIEITLNAKVGQEYTISSDIVFANTIPLKNFKFHLLLNSTSGFKSVTYIFNIFDTYPTSHMESSVRTFDPEKPCEASYDVIYPDKIKEYYEFKHKIFDITVSTFGALTMIIEWASGGTTKMVVPMACDTEIILPPTSIFSWTLDNINYLEALTQNSHIIHLDKNLEDAAASQLFTGEVIFYAINCALLNPTIKEVFEKHSSTIPCETKKSTGTNKRAKIRYIKRHLITFNDIKNAFEKRGFVRKTMIWYVTGHWREYKDGKRIFIQGYWKGTLRHLKDCVNDMPIDPRDREIIVDETTKVAE